LLVNAPEAKFVIQEMGSRELASGKPGGQRTYSHAFQKVDYPVQNEPVDLTVALTPSAQVSGLVVDANGKPVEGAQIISRLNVFPGTTWRGSRSHAAKEGRFAVFGWRGDEPSSVLFWDPDRKVGATMELSARDADREVRVELAPAGAASMRFVDIDGKPIAEYQPTLYLVATPGALLFSSDKDEQAKLAADMDFVANIDRKNHDAYQKSGVDGRMTFASLIPGATYRLMTYVKGNPLVMKDFVAKAGQTLELGDVTVPERPQE
jgi:hypothetical protein